MPSFTTLARIPKKPELATAGTMTARRLDAESTVASTAAMAVVVSLAAAMDIPCLAAATAAVRLLDAILDVSITSKVSIGIHEANVP